MRASRIFFIVCGLFAAMPAWADMSGTYVGKSPTLAMLLQIVETSGGNLTGRYEEVVLQADGKLENTSATLTGVRNGETVVATIKGTILFFAANIPVSGTYRRGALHLTGGGNVVLDLVRADESNFRTQMAALSAQSQQIIGARTRQDAANKQANLEAGRLAKLQNLIGRLTTFTATADAWLPKFGPEAQRYRTITEQMRRGLARQRAIYGGGQASVARGQLSVDLNQLAIAANQIHLDHQQSYRDFHFNADQLNREVIEANTWCQGAVPASLNEVCPKFLGALTGFAQRVAALQVAFADLEGIWIVERREQEAIVETSQRTIQ